MPPIFWGLASLEHPLSCYCFSPFLAKLAKGSSDLRYLLTQHGLQEAHQGELFASGVDTVAKFAAFATTEEDLKDVIKTSFAIDPAASLHASPSSHVCGGMADCQG